MIGVGTRLRPGRLKLGLRLGVPPVVVPPTNTLDNTNGTSTVARSTVANFGPGYENPLRAIAAQKGLVIATPVDGSVAAFVNEVEEALEAAEEASLPMLGPITFDPIVTRSGQDYTFTARRSSNLANAESRTINVGGSTAYPPAALASDFGGSFPTATANFAAGSPTAQFTIAANAAVQPE